MQTLVSLTETSSPAKAAGRLPHLGACLSSPGQVAASLIPCWVMSKDFRPWKIDEAQLLPPSVQDYVAKDHLSRLIVALVRESLILPRSPAATRAGSASRRSTRG